MTYASNLQESQMDACPEFYRFSYAGKIDYYTTWPVNLNFMGETYVAAAMKRSGLKADDKFSRVTMTIQAPMLDAFLRHVANDPVEATQVKVYRAIKSDLTDYVLFFNGYVLAIAVQDLQCKATCEAGSDTLESIGPTVIYQSYCNHVIYDDGCGLDSQAWKVTAAVSSITGATYTVPGLSAYGDGYFAGGYAECQGDQRLITAHTGNNVTLHVPFESRVGIGTAVDFFPGCRGDAATCKNKFNNFGHFQGFPYVPSNNPVVWAIQ